VHEKLLPEHHCHAIGCTVLVPPRLFMCRPHWFQLPRRLRDAVWATYVPGQELTKDPSPEWLRSANEAVQWVAEREGRRPVKLDTPGGE